MSELLLTLSNITFAAFASIPVGRRNAAASLPDALSSPLRAVCLRLAPRLRHYISPDV